MGVKIEGKVEKVNGKELDYKEFVRKYMGKNQPVVLTGLMDDWRACKDWVYPDGILNLNFFSSNFGNSKVQVHGLLFTHMFSDFIVGQPMCVAGNKVIFCLRVNLTLFFTVMLSCLFVVLLLLEPGACYICFADLLLLCCNLHQHVVASVVLQSASAMLSAAVLHQHVAACYYAASCSASVCYGLIRFCVLLLLIMLRI